MDKLSSNALRAVFLDFFRDRQHSIVPGSSLVPSDNTLLFTNAGMVQFKDTFLGLEKRPYVRAASCQRCVRAGGKHNDLDNVGYTARHHTFFEMLGNFSFGDYFKREAIQFAWGFLTDVLRIPADKLWVTVYHDDEEAAGTWLHDIKVDPKRFTRIDTLDNFWSMGETGPCGPCTEIFYDHGPSVAGGPPGSSEQDGDRYVEIWNLVFMQFNRSADGTMTPLPRPSVDTGMGLERLAAVMQGVHSNYEIDLFQHLLHAAAKVTGQSKKSAQRPELRVIADHIRSSSFLIMDGVQPANTEHGYVLRRIIRRAIRHGYELGIKEPFFHKLVQPLCEQMGEAYPELVQARAHIESTLSAEEEKFAKTLESGMKRLESIVEKLQGSTIPGDVVFDLYATSGFPADLTADYARRRRLDIDWNGFEQAKRKHEELGGAGAKFNVVLPSDVATAFTGYDHMRDRATVQAIYKNDMPADTLEAGEEGIVYLDRTPFYAESGGQVGDTGVLKNNDAEFIVNDTQKYHSHIGRLVRGHIRVGDSVDCEIHGEKRDDTARNHSATHLLHAALRQVLGRHVQQKGSLVDADRLRFDFSHPQAMTAEQIQTIETIVNDQIRANAGVEAREMSYPQAIESGAMALFGEKYGDQVRVLTIGAFSTELCGGTHVRRAGDIGFFKILSESGTSAGVRRIEALTGRKAVIWAEQMENRIRAMASLMKTSIEQLPQRLQQTLDRVRILEKELEQLKTKVASSQGAEMLQDVVEIAGVKLLAMQVENSDPNTLRETVDRLKDRMGSGVVVLGAIDEGKVRLVAGVTKDLIGKLKAGDLIAAVAQQVGGKGGGRPDFAQAGGTLPEMLPQALKSVSVLLESRLKA